MTQPLPAPAAGTTTDPAASDPRLRGRTYAIPFDAVWRAALALADGGLARWRLERADDRAGVMEAVAETALLRRVDHVTVRVGLDENGQTRVDLTCRREKGHPKGRRHRRVVGHFVRGLDRALQVLPGQVIDPTLTPAWIAPTAPRPPARRAG